MDIQLRLVTGNDVALLQNISVQTFSETFAALNTQQNMAAYLNEAFSIEKLTTELADPESSFYFALVGDSLIGYLKLNYGCPQSEAGMEKALEIARIYVCKEYQGKKVGQFLFEKAIQTALKKNAEYVWLGVWEKNTRAIEFYRKNGFIPFGTHIFMLGQDAQTDILMRRNLPK